MSSLDDIVTRLGQATAQAEEATAAYKGAIMNVGYKLYRAFDAAVTLTQVNEAVQFSVGGIFYRWDGVFPQGGLVIPQNTPEPSPEQTGLGKYVAVLDISVKDAILRLLASDDGASLIGVSAGGPSSASRKASDKLQESVSVSDYARVGDSHAAWLSAANTAAKQKGRPLLIDTVLDIQTEVSITAPVVDTMSQMFTPTSKIRWLNGQGIRPEYFCPYVDGTADNYAGLNAAFQAMARYHVPVLLESKTYVTGQDISISAKDTSFSTVKVRGTAKTTGVAAGYVPARVGSAIVRKGDGPVLTVKFDNFSAENFDIKGVAFVDSRYYPVVVAPNTHAAIEIIKGDASDSTNTRYISNNGLTDCAFHGFLAAVRFAGVYTNKQGAFGNNYIGPTKLSRCCSYNTRHVMLFENVSLNHLVIDSSIFHHSAAVAFLCSKNSFESGVDGTGGFVNMTLRNCVLEGLKGLFNLTETRSGERNTIVFDGTLREDCEAYSGSGALLSPGPADIIVTGVKDDGASPPFAETTGWVVDSDQTISSDTPLHNVVIRGTGVVNTPELINVVQKEYVVPAGSSITITPRTSVTTGPASVKAEVLLNAGEIGRANVYFDGIPQSGRIRSTVVGDLPSGVSVPVVSDVTGDIGKIAINNTYQNPLYISVRLVSTRGPAVYLA